MTELKKKPKKRKKSKPEPYESQLWRKAVKAFHGDRCVFIGDDEIECDNIIECHHIIPRRDGLLKYDYKNGIPLCKGHHSIAQTIQGREMIRNFIGEDQWQYLKKMELYPKKQYLQDNRLSEKEFLLKKREELKSIISGKI